MFSLALQASGGFCPAAAMPSRAGPRHQGQSAALTTISPGSAVSLLAAHESAVRELSAEDDDLVRLGAERGQNLGLARDATHAREEEDRRVERVEEDARAREKEVADRAV